MLVDDMLVFDTLAVHAPLRACAGAAFICSYKDRRKKKEDILTKV